MPLAHPVAMAMELMVTAIVGSTALECHANVSTTSRMYLMRFAEKHGYVSEANVCIFAPYWIGIALARALMALGVGIFGGPGGYHLGCGHPTFCFCNSIPV